ncbi:MAG: GNAT family N-acetyltransferase [Alphaproteobacteria bacterium]|nr:GNAT family N-acetyltransferase [Alphaproteobacteria bacterium]
MVPNISPSPSIPVIETERLRLRGFAAADKPAYGAMRADPDVVRFLVGGEALIPFAQEIAESRIRAFREAWSNGFGVWAVEEKITGRLLGQTGLARLERSNDVEILYAFARHAWGNGYAREAARAALAFGFETVGLSRIVAFVVAENTASARVLEAIGLTGQGETTYGGFPVLSYAITADEWQA